MTLAQIFELALRQLDEDPADIADYEFLFKVYANEGYKQAVRTYLKPLQTMTLNTNANGEVYIGGMDMGRIVEIRDSHGREVWYTLSINGEAISTLLHSAKLTVTYEENDVPALAEMGDVPILPEFSHPAIADYICYRHLMNGNMAKQSRAQSYLQRYHQIMHDVRHQGVGSVTRMRNLYAASDIRNR